MKVKKDTQLLARRLLRMCLVDGRIDQDKVRWVTQRIMNEKPRNYIPLLYALTKLVGYTMRQYTATIQSAVELSDQERQEIQSRLENKYGAGLIYEWQVEPSLIAGIKVRVGDDMIDGSVLSRITRLKDLASTLSH